MKRLAWGLAALVGCSVADEPTPSPGDERSLSDFDPAEYSIVAIDDVDARDVEVEIDGERVELASVVEADWVVRRRDVELPVADETVDAPPTELGLTASADPEAVCACAMNRKYEVPVYEQIWTCMGTKGGGPPTCVSFWAFVVHHIGCFSACSPCGYMLCWDSTDDSYTDEPDAEYLVGSTGTSCINPTLTCGGL